jgi:hypothetical protein
MLMLSPSTRILTSYNLFGAKPVLTLLVPLESIG